MEVKVRRVLPPAVDLRKINASSLSSLEKEVMKIYL